MNYLLQCPGCDAHTLVDDASDATAITRELNEFLPSHSACSGGVSLRSNSECGARSPDAFDGS